LLAIITSYPTSASGIISFYEKRPKIKTTKIKVKTPQKSSFTLTVLVYHGIIALLKPWSLVTAIEEFSLAWPSLYMSHYTMLYKYRKRTVIFLCVLIFIIFI